MKDFAGKFSSAILFCIDSHANHPKTISTRSWDRKTPYAVHLLWCATTFLQETNLSKSVKRDREQCALALLFHDLIEDTTAILPSWLPKGVLELIEQMTFSDEVGSTEIEIEEIWSRPPIVRLLKIYDKASNLLDGSWMPNEKWNNQYVPYVLRLADDVEANYGDLNIVRMSRAVAIKRPVSETTQA